MNLQINRPDIKLHTICFVIGYAVFLLTLLFPTNIAIVNMMDSGMGFIGNGLKLLRYLSYLLLLIGVTDRLVRKNKILAVICAAVFLAVEVLFSKNNTMLLYVFLFAGASVVDAGTVIKTSFFTKGFFLLFTVIPSQLGIIQDYIFLDGTRHRHGLGFSWTTTGTILFLHLVLEYIYLRREKITVLEFALLELVNIWFYRMTDTSMAFYITTAFLVYFAIVRLEKNKFFLSRKIEYAMPLLPLICFGVSVWAQYAYNENNGVWKMLNEFVHNRLMLGHNAIQNYGFSLFGQKMEWIGFSVRAMAGEYNYVDCSYLQLMIEYGTLFILLVVAVYTILMIRGLIHKDYYLIAILAFVLVFAMTEPRLMNLMFTSFPLLVTAVMKEKERTDGLKIFNRKFVYG